EARWVDGEIRRRLPDRHQELAYHPPILAGRLAGEAAGRKLRRAQELGETEAVTEREAAGDAAGVPGDLATLVDHQVRKVAAREDRLRAPASSDMPEEGVPAGKHERQAADARALEDLLEDGRVEPPVGAARGHARRERDPGEDVGRRVDGLQRDVAAEGLAGEHHVAIAELPLRGRLLQGALDTPRQRPARH